MNTNTKFFVGIGLATILLVVAGVFLLGRNTGQESEVGGVADQAVLTANTRHAIGDPNAPVKIVEFADFQCPACQAAHPIVKKILDANKDKVYFVFRHYPLPTHKNAKQAARACEAAGIQGKFWEMHDFIFTRQKDWSEKSNVGEIFGDYAQELGLDIGRFKEDMKNVDETINSDYADGNKLGVDSTPTFFVNGQKYPGVLQESQFQQIIDGTN